MELEQLPGFIDTHVHFREPGINKSENIKDGTRAAVAGGVIVVVDMPNTIPKPIDNPVSLYKRRDLAYGQVYCDYGQFFLAKGSSVEYFERVKNNVFGFKGYFDETTGGYIVNTPEEQDLVVRSIPDGSELIAHAEGATLARILALRKKYHKRLHVAHVSLAEEVRMIAKAKERDPGMITAEVTPHALFLTEDDVPNLEYEGFGRMKPPLPTGKDQMALWDGIHDGTIDTVGTDHASHPLEDKKKFDPKKGPFGVPGVETMGRLLLTAVAQKRLTLEEVKRLTYYNPIEIFGIRPPEASYILVNMAEKSTIHARDLKTICGWTPFEDFETTGVIKRVVLRGESIYFSGAVNDPPKGRVIRPIAA